MGFPKVVFRLPEWLEEHVGQDPRAVGDARDRMRLVIEWSRLNVARGTGGPFAAGVFECDSGRLIAPGVNVVVAANCSIAHAEVVAIATAQRVLGSYDLGAEGMPACELVSSAEPCAMCLGAVPWSGVRRLVCAARDQDVRGIGFDEGDKPPDWVRSLERRRIAVQRDVLRAEAVAVLEEYRRSGGVIYNAGGTAGP